MFDRFDGRRFVVDVVAVLLIGLCERSWRERERRKTPLAGLNSSCRHGLTLLWWINRKRMSTERSSLTALLNFSIADGFDDPAEWGVCINYGLNSPISRKLLFNTKERSGMVPVKTAVAL